MRNTFRGNLCAPANAYYPVSSSGTINIHLDKYRGCLLKTGEIAVRKIKTEVAVDRHNAYFEPLLPFLNNSTKLMREYN